MDQQGTHFISSKISWFIHDFWCMPILLLKEKFQNQGSLTMLKEKHVECLERTGDNRTSHFILGADSEPKRSEQVR